MRHAVLKAINGRKWIFALFLFSIGLLTPYFFRGFFQNLSAKTTTPSVSSLTGDYPPDLRKRFMDAVALTNENKISDAVNAYESIVKVYPNYPEPYNNLAILYAQTGRLNEARQQLEKALQTNTAYAAVYNNLAGVYERMASDAYRKALNLDKSLGGQPLAHLKPITEIGVGSAAALALNQAIMAATPSPVSTANAPAAGTPCAPAASDIIPRQPAPVLASSKTSTPSAQQVAVSQDESRPVNDSAKKTPFDEPLPVLLQEKPLVIIPPVSPENDGRKNSKAPIIQRLNNWAAAWSKKDTKAYLAAYSPDFKVPRGRTRAQWEQERRRRITEKESIQVKIKDIQVEFLDDKRAKVRFAQRYEAGNLKTSVRKTMIFKKTNASTWHIEEERIG